VIHGQIVTEIEALRLLTDAEAVQIGAGGIGGAEGAVWLMVKGTEEAVSRATALVEQVQGEPAFCACVG
jgi:6-phosphogluconate dehydrogenase (decarboxylating)